MTSNESPPPETSPDPPRLHNVMRCLLKQARKTIPDLSHNETVATTEKDKADLLNTFFVSQNQLSVGSPDEVIPPIHVPRVPRLVINHHSHDFNIRSGRAPLRY